MLKRKACGSLSIRTLNNALRYTKSLTLNKIMCIWGSMAIEELSVKAIVVFVDIGNMVTLDIDSGLL
jgi:hypothetical protein